MMKAIGYIRVSTEEQAKEGVSLAAQEAKIKAYCELYDLEIVEIIVDAGQSAKTLKRPGLQQALGMLESGMAEAIVIAKLDRLTRSVTDWGTLIDRFFSKQYALLSVGDQIDTRTAAGRLVLNVLVSVAQWEREAIGERTATALAHKKNQGDHVGSPAFGFKMVEKKLIKIDSETETIDLARSLRGQGMTLQSIADELTRREIQTKRGGTWRPSTLKYLLDRTA